MHIFDSYCMLFFKTQNKCKNKKALQMTGDFDEVDMSVKIKKSHVNYGEKMYQKGLMKERVKQKKMEEKRLVQKETELQKLTFQPNLNKGSHK